MTRPALSPRESQCARLAVLGNRDREIAAILSLSTRTVSNYLLSAYTKLGIRGRLELATALDGAE